MTGHRQYMVLTRDDSLVVIRTPEQTQLNATSQALPTALAAEDDDPAAESEDEDGEELTPAVDAAILRTLARIKRKDPAIYQQGKDVFEGMFHFVHTRLSQ